MVLDLADELHHLCQGNAIYSFIRHIKEFVDSPHVGISGDDRQPISQMPGLRAMTTPHGSLYNGVG